MGTNFLKKRECIVEIKKQIEELRSEYDELLGQLRCSCSHETVVEVGHGVLHESAGPRKICVLCSAEEDGWGCGYQTLVEKPSRVLQSSDEFYKYRDLPALKRALVVA